MPHSLEEVEQFAYELPRDQRIMLANYLWESVAPQQEESTEAEIETSWKDEVNRRVAQVNAGTALTCSWDEMEAELCTAGQVTRTNLRIHSQAQSEICEAFDGYLKRGLLTE